MSCLDIFLYLCFMNTVGQNIRKIRELKGFSQEYMAQQLAISQRQFSRLENNETDINLSKLQEISNLLEVTLTQLLGFDEKFIFQNCTNNGFGNHNQNQYGIAEKERELYEKRIEQLENELTFLKKQFEILLMK
jgi:transcriptional regulator with XRE-family HTH domain